MTCPPRFLNPEPRTLNPLFVLAALLITSTCSAATLQTLDGKSYEGDIRFENNQIVITSKGRQPAKLDLDDIFRASFKPADPPKPAGASGFIDRIWNSADVGPTGVGGGVRLFDGKFAVKGAGADVKGTADSFYYIYQELRGDGQIIARISDLQRNNPDAKAGLMIREYYNERGSRTEFVYVQPQGGVGLSWRSQTNGEMTITPPSTAEKPPVWLRLARVKNMVIAYKSADGNIWTPVGQPLDFQSGADRRDRGGRRAYIGLAVCSHDVNAPCAATFSDVTLQPAWSGDEQLRAPGAEGGRSTGPTLSRGVVFRGGTIIGGLHVQSADEKSIKIHRGDGKSLSLATSEVARLIVGPVTPQQLAMIPPMGVGVLLAKGDFIEGEFASLRDGRVKISSVVFGPRELAVGAEAIVIVLRDLATSQASWIVKTQEGFVYMARSIKLERDQLTIDDEAVGLLKVPAWSIVELKTGPGRVDSLAILKPSRIEAGSGLSTTAAYATSLPDGAPMTLGGHACERGVVSRAGASIHFDLDGKSKFFLCRAGVPEGMLPTTAIRFVVLLDGKEAYRSPLQTSLDDPASVSLNVAGAKTLVLRIETAGNVSLPALGVWGDPVTVR
jgi:hypothetical protein